MDDQRKCGIYTTLLNSLGKNGDLAEVIDESTYNNQIKLIKHDLVSNVESDQETALQMLQILIENHLHTIHRDVIDILNDSNMNNTIKDRVLEAITKTLKDMLRACNIIEFPMFYNVWRSHQEPKFADMLREVCNSSKYRQYCKTFLFTGLIPLIFDTKNTSYPSKVICIDMALEIASVLATNLSTEEYGLIIKRIDEYINNILKLRDANFEHWHKLWIFLIRLLGKRLHSVMFVTNKLLRVAEHAFKNSSQDERLRGYECWKELIDNASLNPQHLSSERQIKLLLTPLRAKLSRQEPVIRKRFDVFIYLMEKLQDKAVLVLKEFLEFCFGDVGEKTDSHKAGHGKCLPHLWIESAKILLEILGHVHDKKEICLQPNCDVHIITPMLNSANISKEYYHVINSVAECCRLLKNVELNHKNTVLICFWRSLFNIILADEVVQRHKCIEHIGKVLDDLLQGNDPYEHGIAVIIFKEAIKTDGFNHIDLLLHNLDRFLSMVFTVPLSQESYIDMEKFLAKLRSVQLTEETTGLLFNSFIKYKSSETNPDFVAAVWIFLAYELDDYSRGSALNFLVWPVLHAHQLKESAKEAAVYECYRRLIVPFVERSDDVHLAFFEYCEKVLKNNPLLLKNILSVITMFNPKTRHKDITNVTLEMFAYMLLVSARIDGVNPREAIESYLKKLYQANVANINDQETIKKLCACLEHLLESKQYGLLPVVHESLVNLPESVKSIYGKFLTLDFLVNVFDQERDLKVNLAIHKLIELLRNVKSPESKKSSTSATSMGGRSAKIANLVKQIASSPQAISTASPPPLRLFGKDIETRSPLKVVGSQLKTSPKKPRKSTPTPTTRPSTFIDDESNSKFVLIESEVKLDKAKLTEHQKETLKRRREDIPALYQDLSQSASQSFDSNSCNAIIKPNELFKKPAELDFSARIDVSNAPELDKLKDDSSKSKNSKRDKELKKLSMDIVGAEEFIAAGPKRKRRDMKFEPDPELLADENASGSLIVHSPVTKLVLTKRGRPRAASTKTGKSKRNSLPTEKLKQSELVRHSPKSLRKVTTSKSLPATEKYTQSELFKQTETEPQQVEDKRGTSINKKNWLSCENGFGNVKKRKRVYSSEEDDDIIESSQGSAASNSSAAKLRWSTSSRSSCLADDAVNTSKPKNRASSDDEDAKCLLERMKDNTKHRTLNEAEKSSKRLSRTPKNKGEQNRSYDASPTAAPLKKSKKKGRKESPKSAEKLREIPNESPNLFSTEPINSGDAAHKSKSPNSASSAPKSMRELESGVNTTNEIGKILSENTKIGISTEHVEMHTQSQDTQTQDTEPLQIDGEVQLQLDLPEKMTLTDSEVEIARMDTLSLPLLDESAADVDGTVVQLQTAIKHDLEEIIDAEEVWVEPNEVDSACKTEQGDNETENCATLEGPVVSRQVSGLAGEIVELVRQMVDIAAIKEPDHLSPIRAGPSESCVGTPGPFIAALPSSPITRDTPNRTLELLNNTSDISPIGSQSNSGSDKEFVEDLKLVPVALKFDHEDDSPETQSQKSPEKSDAAPLKNDVTSPEKEVEVIVFGSPSASESKDNATVVEKSNSRFSWMKQGGSPSTTHRIINRRKGGITVSPSISRIKKLMSNVKPSSKSDQAGEISQEDILTFSREVPSPLAVPRSSILKRKCSDSNDDGLSPCAKRKRVNFSDPCTTSKKVFIKEDSAQRQCIFSLGSNEDLDRLEVLEANSVSESDPIETEPSLQLNNPMLLRDDHPIYPELIDCEENVGVICRRLTGPMFVNVLLSKLEDKNIKTIGDLARQTEVDIARLSFKSPMLATVYQALDNYYHKNFKCKASAEKVDIVDLDRDVKIEVEFEMTPMRVIVDKLDVKTELGLLLKKARSEDVPEEKLWALVLGSADQKAILSWFKSHFNVQPHDMVEDNDFPALLKHQTESLGLPRILDMLLESSEDESVHFDCMTKHLIDKRPLASLIEKRNLEELETAIWENVENEKYCKQDLLATCFLPYIYPIDLASFFNKLTVVEIGDIVLNRLRSEDYKTFMERIMKRCSNRQEVSDVILQTYSTSGLTDNIIRRGPSEILASFASMLSSFGQQDKEDLVHIFRLVNDRLADQLPSSRRMALFIEYVQKIPIKD